MTAQELTTQMVTAPSGPWVIILAVFQVGTLIAVGTLIWRDGKWRGELTAAIKSLMDADERAVQAITAAALATKEDKSQYKVDLDNCFEMNRKLELRVRELEIRRDEDRRGHNA